MSDTNREGTLAAPHHCITIRAWRGRHALEVKYIAPSRDALIAAGLLDEFMLNKMATQKRGARKDARGVTFQFWERAGYARLRRMLRNADLALALELPGVRDLWPDGIPEWTEPDRTQRSYLHEQLAMLNATCGQQPVNLHAKALGRFQRFVAYAAVGDVLVPDWSRIQSETILARHTP